MSKATGKATVGEDVVVLVVGVVVVPGTITFNIKLSN